MFAKIKKASMKTLCLFMVLLLIASFAPVVIDAGAEEMPETLPSSVDLTLPVNGKYYFPEIGHQGRHGSCAVWATVYYQYTYEVAKLNDINLSQTTALPFSEKYIFNYVNYAYSDSGSSIESNYKLLQEIGSIPYDEFKDEHEEDIVCPENSCNKWYQGDTLEESLEMLREALKIRISSYHKEKFMSRDSSTTIPDITSYDDPDLDLIKSRLADGKALVFSCNFQSFTKKNMQNGEKIVVKLPYPSVNNHTMTIVGYDDSIWYDFNGNTVIENWEKGAFKVANSWGASEEDSGFFWLAYDALNKVSNYSRYNSNRSPAIYNNEYYYIDVENHTPQLTVEVTVTTRDRSGFSLALQRYNYRGTIEKTTFLNGSNELAGELPESDAESTTWTRAATDYEGRLGEDAQVGTRVFVFDYSSLAYDDLYDSDNAAVYGLVAEDLDLSYNNGSTVIEKIVWRDSNGNVLKTIMPNDTLNASSETYLLGEFVSGISLNKTYTNLKIGDGDQLVANITGNNATQGGVVWSSDNTATAIVDQEGVVTAVGIGYTTITATAMDGSGVSASCSVNVPPSATIDNKPTVWMDSRRACFEIILSKSLTSLELHVGDRVYTINKTSDNTINTYINDGYIDSVTDRVRVRFTPVSDTANVKWNIQIALSQATLGGEEEVYFVVKYNNNLRSFRLDDSKKYVFWKSSIRTGITEGTTLASIIVPLNEQLGADSQYRYIAVNGVTGEVVFDYDDSATNNSTIAGTGIIILKVGMVDGDDIVDISDAIIQPYEVIHLLMYGDITGSGAIGDGMIEVDDALRALQHYSATSELSDEIFILAADIDCNGMITRSDVDSILAYAANMTTDPYYQFLSTQNRPALIYNSIIYNGYTVTFQ